MTFDDWWWEHFEHLAGPLEKGDVREVWDAAVAAEREACAQIAIQKGIRDGHLETCGGIAAAIRARGEYSR